MDVLDAAIARRRYVADVKVVDVDNKPHRPVQMAMTMVPSAIWEYNAIKPKAFPDERPNNVPRLYCPEQIIDWSWERHRKKHNEDKEHHSA